MVGRAVNVERVPREFGAEEFAVRVAQVWVWGPVCARGEAGGICLEGFAWTACPARAAAARKVMVKESIVMIEVSGKRTELGRVGF